MTRIFTMTDRQLVRHACQFAHRAHAGIGQVRKYTGLPYVTHPVAVAGIVAAVTSDAEVVAAALLHDIIEDTPITLVQLKEEFGERISQLVNWVSDVSVPADGNRAARKALDRAYLLDAPYEAKLIKLADVVDNVRSIVFHDPGYAREVYLPEKRLLLDESLYDGNLQLWHRADVLVRQGMEALVA